MWTTMTPIWMTLTFLNVCKLAINKAGRKEKERLFQNRKQQEQKNHQIKEVAQDYQGLIKDLQEVAWANIPLREKEKQFQKMLPQAQSNESGFDDFDDGDALLSLAGPPNLFTSTNHAD